MYPNDFDSFTNIKKNGDSITESVPLSVSAVPVSVDLTYAILQGVTIPGWTEVTTTPAVNQFRVQYGSTTVQFGPVIAATTVNVTYVTRGTLLTDAMATVQALAVSMANVQQALGLNPNGTYSTLAARLTATDSTIVHNHYSEDFSGLCNGAATVFTLSQIPTAPTVTQVVLNGSILVFGTDYTLVGSTITMLEAPLSGDSLVVYYIV